MIILKNNIWAPIAQWIERFPAEEKMAVRISLGAPH